MIHNELEKLYNDYHREVYLYAFSLCKDYHLAQDLTSDTFFKAMLSLDDNTSYIKYWLFRVCKNLFLDNVRKDNRFSETNNLDEIMYIKETPLDRLIENEEKKQLYRLVMGLRPSYREILILYYYCDFTLSEITKATGLTEGAAKVLLFRARKNLKVQLEGEK